MPPPERPGWRGLLRLANESRHLDVLHVLHGSWPTYRKVHFILRKYAIIGRHVVRPFCLGQSRTRVGGRTIYYDSPYGLAGYQRQLSSQYSMLKLAKVDRPQLVLDCGANVGYFTMMVKEAFPDATVHAFEPVPVVFDCLARNLEGYDGVELHRLALSDTAGTATMEFSEEHSETSSLSASGNLEVITETLDAFVEAHGITHIDVLKVDTEKHELQVLRGGEAALAVTDHLCLEVTIEDNPNYTMSSLFGSLVGPGYDFQLVGFRSFTGKAEGALPAMDCILVNTQRFQL